VLKAISQSTLRPHTPSTQYSIERLLRARTEADRGDCDFLSSQQLTGMVLLSRERVHRLQSTVGRKVRRCSTIRTLPLKRYSTLYSLCRSRQCLRGRRRRGEMGVYIRYCCTFSTCSSVLILPGHTYGV
jgi:hypothetical protein